MQFLDIAFFYPNGGRHLIIIIQKSGKAVELVESYKLMSLLPVLLKLFEKLLNF